ncbi:MAG: threonine synthase [Synergistaceae bacterium]|jgi:threonine synthase|nr:threonine synthase [Synergistaceae bacterium]
MYGTNSYIKRLICPRCDKKYSHETEAHLCECGSPLLVEYDIARAKSELKRPDIEARKPDLWRYMELLPVLSEENIVSLGEGFTPLLSMCRAGEKIGLGALYVKDEGVIPTGTFKARGAAVGVSKAKEFGARMLVMPTNGNAGAAWALYGARAGISVTIVMPEDAPYITRVECAAAGAELYLARGLISDCGRIVERAISKYGWYNASTLKEPYRIEGKKTMGYEIVEQLGWSLPDVILYPTGGGVGIIGIYKALLELRELGWVSGALPRLVAVQAEGCSPIVKAFNEKKAESEFYENSRTVAFGINVPKALGDFLVLDAIYSTGGCAVSVSDEEILSSQSELGRLEGLFVCPEGAALYAAARNLRAKGWIGKDDFVVLLNTGAGVKYSDTIAPSSRYLAPDAGL